MGKGRLGMMVMSLTPELRVHFGATSTTGLLVGSVDPGSPAEKAGVRVGDVLIRANDQSVDDIGDLRAAIASRKKGEAVELAVIRDRKELALTAALATDPLPSFDSLWSGSWLRDFFGQTKGA
jgi:S1-C subfamily serine protease